MDGLETLRKEGMNDLVLDLQDNGGGYLKAAVDIADELLHKGDLIVYTEGRQCPRTDYKARGSGGFGYDPLVLLPAYNKTVAELSAQEKNAMSHRGKAARVILALLDSLQKPTA